MAKLKINIKDLKAYEKKVRNNWELKIISLLLAVFIWLYVIL